MEKALFFVTRSGNPPQTGLGTALRCYVSFIVPCRATEGTGAETTLSLGGDAVAAQQRGQSHGRRHFAVRPSLCRPYPLRWGTTRLRSRRAYLRHAFATTFAMAAKFGVPRPVDASQPLIAAQPSVLPPMALVPCVTSLNMPGFW